MDEIKVEENTEQEEPKKKYHKIGQTESYEEAAEIARMGGIASGKARREKAYIAQAVNVILKKKAKGDIRKMLIAMGCSDDELTNCYAVAATLIAKAIDGNDASLGQLIDINYKDDENERKQRESEARIAAMKGGDVSVSSSDDEDGDVVIYLPKIDDATE